MSRVLTALRLADWRVRSALRLTLGRETTEAQIGRTVGILAGIAARLR